MLTIQQFLKLTAYKATPESAAVNVTELSDEQAHALWQAHEETLYFNVQGNQARQWLFANGWLEIIESLTEDETEIAGTQSKLGTACKVILKTCETGGEFTADPTSTTGQLCIAGLTALDTPSHCDGILTKFLEDFTKPQQRPGEHSTLYDIMCVRNNAPVTAAPNHQNGWITITTNGETPKHRPQLVAKTSENGYERVSNFPPITVADSYKVWVPYKYRTGVDLFVHNPYGAIGA